MGRLGPVTGVTIMIGLLIFLTLVKAERELSFSQKNLQEVARMIKTGTLPVLSGDVPTNWTAIALAGERGFPVTVVNKTLLAAVLVDWSQWGFLRIYALALAVTPDESLSQKMISTWYWNLYNQWPELYQYMKLPVCPRCRSVVDFANAVIAPNWWWLEPEGAELFVLRIALEQIAAIPLPRVLFRGGPEFAFTSAFFCQYWQLDGNSPKDCLDQMRPDTVLQPLIPFATSTRLAVAMQFARNVLYIVYPARINSSGKSLLRFVEGTQSEHEFLFPRCTKFYVISKQVWSYNEKILWNITLQEVP